MKEKLFSKALDAINKIKQTIDGKSYDEAAKILAGYNEDGELFDYDFPIDEEYYLVGTIYKTTDNKPYMPIESMYYECWKATDGVGGMIDAVEIFEMSEAEIKQQIERIGY